MIAVPKKTWCPSNFVFAELQNFSDLYFVTASKGSIRLTKFCCKFLKVAINSGPTNKAINKTFGEHPIFVTHPVRFKITYYYCYQGNGGNSRMERKLENLRKYKEIEVWVRNLRKDKETKEINDIKGRFKKFRFNFDIYIILIWPYLFCWSLSLILFKLFYGHCLHVRALFTALAVMIVSFVFGFEIWNMEFKILDMKYAVLTVNWGVSN